MTLCKFFSGQILILHQDKVFNCECTERKKYKIFGRLYEIDGNYLTTIQRNRPKFDDWRMILRRLQFMYSNVIPFRKLNRIIPKSTHSGKNSFKKGWLLNRPEGTCGVNKKCQKTLSLEAHVTHCTTFQFFAHCATIKLKSIWSLVNQSILNFLVTYGQEINFHFSNNKIFFSKYVNDNLMSWSSLKLSTSKLTKKVVFFGTQCLIFFK